jgi:hypothetical protein
MADPWIWNSSETMLLDSQHVTSAICSKYRVTQEICVCGKVESWPQRASQNAA